MEELFSSCEVLLVLGTRFLHGRMMKRGGVRIDTVVVAYHIGAAARCFLCDEDIRMVLYCTSLNVYMKNAENVPFHHFL